MTEDVICRKENVKTDHKTGKRGRSDSGQLCESINFETGTETTIRRKNITHNISEPVAEVSV